MSEEPKQTPPGVPPTMKKGCHISLMFPCDTDDEALAVKKAIDGCIPDVEGKRYNFQITEM